MKTRSLGFLDPKTRLEAWVSISPSDSTLYIKYVFHHLEFSSWLIETWFHTSFYHNNSFLIGHLRSHIQDFPKSSFLARYLFFFKFSKICFTCLFFLLHLTQLTFVFLLPENFSSRFFWDSILYCSSSILLTPSQSSTELLSLNAQSSFLSPFTLCAFPGLGLIYMPQTSTLLRSPKFLSLVF